MAAMGRAEPGQRAQHVAGHLVAGLDRPALLQIQQHLGQAVVLVVQADAADQVGAVLPVGQPARGHAGLAARRQHPHRRTAGVVTGEGIGVDRHEQVGIVLAGDFVTTLERDEGVVVAGQHRLHAGLAVDLGGEVARHRQGDVLFQRAGRAVGALVLAAMAGVDRHHHGALSVEHRRGLLGGDPAAVGGVAVGDGRDRRAGDGCLGDRRLGTRRAGRVQIQHQPVIVVGGRLEHETLERAGGIDRGDQLQVVAAARMADAEKQALRRRRREAARGLAVAQIHHDLAVLLPYRVMQRTVGIEHHAGVLRPCPDAGVLDLGSLRRARQKRRQHRRGAPTGQLVQITPHGPH